MQLLLDVVSTPSVSGREADVARVVVDAMSRSADEAFVDAAGNAVGRWGTGPVNLTFLAHMDTVRGWIEPRISEGWLHGRGSVDAKGPLCAALVAASRLSAEARAALSVRVIAAVEEEAPSSKGARYAAKTYPRPHALVVCEPSGWQRYTLGYKGNLRARLRCEMDEGHGAALAGGPAAQVVDAWSAVQTWAREARPPEPRLFDSVQARLMSVNSGSDGLTARCSALIGFRLPPSLPWRAAAAALLEVRLPYGVTIAIEPGLDARTAPKDTALAAGFRSAIRAAGGVPVATLKTGTSDWNVVAERWLTGASPVLAYGPGDSTLDHTPDERLEIAEYLRSISVIEGALAQSASEKWRFTAA
ncbi:MAG: M20/M25/M40 family metallo-hydrolase [Trueperaceae bacterium]|nr:M20/M25/M40 family metallo-hydrolase [Trueperaceae bacterium]